MYTVNVFWLVVVLVSTADYTTQKCVLPEHPQHGRHIPFEDDCPLTNSSSAQCRSIPGTLVPEGWLLFVKCDQGFVSEEKAKQDIPHVCADEVWSPSLSHCVYDVTSDPYKCTLPSHPTNGKYEPLSVECALSNTTPVSPGSMVVSACILLYSCYEGYQLSGQDEQVITICDNSMWSPQPSNITCEKTNKEPSTTPPSQPTNTGCVLPQEPRNRKYCSFACDQCSNSNCIFSAGAVVPEKALKVQCERGYRLSTNQEYTVAVCVGESWVPTIPECLKQCPPLESDSLYTQCSYGFMRVNCSQPMLPATTATYQCRPSHKEYPILSQAAIYKRILTCRYNGKWSGQLPECEPVCGVSKGDSKITPTIVNGKDTKLGVFPWHAGLYLQDHDKWKNICGGSLISNRIILTAAHCVAAYDADDLRVALGKYYRSWTQSEPYAVRRNVSAIRVPEEYIGASTMFAWDIALLLLSESVQFNSFMIPVCSDVNSAFDISQNNTGYVVGWGKTMAGGNESETLLHSELTIVNYHGCRRHIPTLLSIDKFCGARESVSVAEKGDSGGGLTAIFGGLHYIFGIVSIKYNNMSLFTNVSWAIHKAWIKNEILHLDQFIS